MKKVSSEKKTLNKKKPHSKKKPIAKLDVMIKDNTNLPLWAKLRVAYGMATKDEIKQFNKITNSIIAKKEKKLGKLKLTCAPDTHCLFTCLQSCTNSCTATCTKSCTDTCTSSCQQDCQNVCTGGCMSTCEQADTCKSSIE